MNEIMKLIEVPVEDKGIIAIDKELLDKLDKPLYTDDSEPPFKEYRSLEDSLNDVSMEEIDIYTNANLEEKEVNDRPCLVKKDIDLDTVDEKGLTNLERMQKGRPPIVDGDALELHHIGQKSDAPLAELTWQEHRGPVQDGVLHDKKVESEIDRNEFKKEREQHWKARAEQLLAERGNE
ncbi:HNH/ENDO VII family nuclease [Solibacillus daqui]|uniref:HNH/ENDO VII family nuclease n=1 Tax=Solibacillus daqui TaxID=2912187 RepID=UPI0023651790|nr:HNH/ENDO VII family nuclease [Solibacillus daqui]